METDHNIVEAATRSFPRTISEAAASWGRQVLECLVPVVTTASVAAEEGELQRFSLAVYKEEWAYVRCDWRFSTALDCEPNQLTKLACLSDAGKTHLVAARVDGKKGPRIIIWGVGGPGKEVDRRRGPWLAEELPSGDRYCWISATVLGPATVLIEGFGRELATLFEGKLRVIPTDPPFSKIEYGAKRPVRRNFPSITVGGVSVGPGLTRDYIMLDVVRRLTREVLLRAQGGLLVFGARSRGSIADTAKLLDEPLSLGGPCCAYCTALDCHRSGQGGGPQIATAQALYHDAINNVVRMSLLDGAVLINNRLEVIGFGAKLKGKEAAPKSIPSGSQGGEPLDLTAKGTRHSSAASWVHSGRGRMALVVSQDKRARLFARSKGVDEVRYWDVMPTFFE
ncbi:MAG TPA: hypothetical protein VF017_05815 [Thermoanaerobaculia bacterium]|nr:hypothetical protein [Thermoanaerobaculia bacterium]